MPSDSFAPRRSSRQLALHTPPKPNPIIINSIKHHIPSQMCETVSEILPPSTSHITNTDKQKKRNCLLKKDINKSTVSRSLNFGNMINKDSKKRRTYYKKLVYDECELEVGDDVYVKRREDTFSDEESEIEECRVCFKGGEALMIECDDCLGGFHLNCLNPPQNEVPEGDWSCDFCTDKKFGRKIPPPEVNGKKKRMRTAKEKLLSSELWAAHIERLWKEPDGTYLLRVRWYIIPEETAIGRQSHNLRRELYITNDVADIEMESVCRHCYVMPRKDFSKAEGDDVFLCEYEYDTHWQSFKHLAHMEMDSADEDNDDTESDKNWESCNGTDSFSESEEELGFENEDVKHSVSVPSSAQFVPANSRKGQVLGFQKLGLKRIPKFKRCHKQSELERAKSALLLGSFPTCLPGRDKEIAEIREIIKGAICDDNCLGRCLYIHGVPGTGKTMSVLSVMKSLKSEVNAGSLKPYCFVEINALKLSSPENIYKVIYEGLSGNRVGRKKALRLLNERFSNEKKKCDNLPCILLIDEFDQLVTKKQSILFNILNWPTMRNSKLVVIGIANTMDLPEKLLPAISSRLGVERLRFGAYNYQQLQAIISSRLKGIHAFETEAIEFASRKVAAISGDARCVLEICRRAAVLTDDSTKQIKSFPNSSLAYESALVGIKEIQSAINEMFETPHIEMIQSYWKYGKIFLTAMVHELKKTGMRETTFEEVARCVKCICESNREETLPSHQLFKIGCNLGGCRIILCEDAHHPNPRMQLNFPSDDYVFALKDCKSLPWLAKYL